MNCPQCGNPLILVGHFWVCPEHGQSALPPLGSATPVPSVAKLGVRMVTNPAGVPGCGLLLVRGTDRRVRLFSAEAFQEVQRFVDNGSVKSEESAGRCSATVVACSARTRRVVSGDEDGTLKVWRMQSGALTTTGLAELGQKRESV